MTGKVSTVCHIIILLPESGSYAPKFGTETMMVDTVVSVQNELDTEKSRQLNHIVVNYKLSLTILYTFHRLLTIRDRPTNVTYGWR